MPRFSKRVATALVLLAILIVPAHLTAAPVNNTEESNSPPVFDLLIIRPLGLAGLAVSAVLWIPAQVITMAVAHKEWEKPIDLMLRKPAAFVFKDPIGSH